jgi:hypothetical protein
MLNFKSFRAAGSVLASIELIRMIRKGQLAIDGTDAMSFADKFFILAGVVVQTKRDIDLPGKFYDAYISRFSVLLFPTI